MANMTVERLHQLFNENTKESTLSWEGICHDCRCGVHVTATPKDDGIHIHGGSVYEPEPGTFLLKCDTCYGNDSFLKNYQPCEVYSRIVGYLRPVAQWNDAKQAEFRDREMFNPNIG